MQKNNWVHFSDRTSPDVRTVYHIREGSFEWKHLESEKKRLGPPTKVYIQQCYYNEQQKKHIIPCQICRYDILGFKDLPLCTTELIIVHNNEKGNNSSSYSLKHNSQTTNAHIILPPINGGAKYFIIECSDDCDINEHFEDCSANRKHPVSIIVRVPVPCECESWSTQGCICQAKF